MNKDKEECPKCLGTKEFFNGFGMKKCKLCNEGEVSSEIKEAYLNEVLIYE